MEKMFIRVNADELKENIEKLQWLLHQAAVLNVQRIVLPFVDSSAIKTEEEKKEVVNILEKVLPLAEKLNIELHLETSLNPIEFTKLLEMIQHPMVKVNYDSGNSASWGYKVEQEFAAYGKRIGSIHIKDRVLGGTTVPLGTGHADLKTLFKEMKGINYQRDLILQVARNIPGDEINWAIHNVNYVKKLLN
jgi:hexulose-6-phosphate isomerase